MCGQRAVGMLGSVFGDERPLGGQVGGMRFFRMKDFAMLRADPVCMRMQIICSGKKTESVDP